MKWLNRLERKLGRNFGIPNLMIYITATMLVVYLVQMVAIPELISYMAFSRWHIMQGQVWRVITFLLVPPSFRPLPLILSLYAMYLIGNSLERAWGTARFTLFYIFGALGAIIAGFITGGATNYYISLSMFLAFAYLFPDATMMLFYLIPVKAKYIAYVDWALYIIAFIFYGWVHRISIVFSLIAFFIFFGPDIWSTMKRNYKTRKNRRSFQQNWRNSKWD